MYAKWIKNTIRVGTIIINGTIRDDIGNNRKVLIEKGEIRKIKVEKDGLFILEGKDGVGSFGWVNPEEIILLETENG